MKKALIISYYWPPSGGAGVQRWLKFTKYLPDEGYQPIVYTALNPEYPSIDKSLLSDIDPTCQVIKQPIKEPYKFYRKLIGKKANETIQSSFLNESRKPQKLEALARWVRGNFFIPDARVFWIKPSVKFLRSYLQKNPVDVIISTGPPHSMHLIARNLHKLLHIPWVTDFRDPWTDIDYYEELKLTPLADQKHRRLEKSVLNECDHIIVVSETMKKEFSLSVDPQKISVIRNGFDSVDLPNKDQKPDRLFTIAHIGSFTPARNCNSLWKAIAELCADPGIRKKLRIQVIGKIDIEVKDNIEKEGIGDLLVQSPYMSHSEVVLAQSRSNLLLLIINRTKNAKGILTGKVFEYLASGRPILAIGPLDGDISSLFEITHAESVIDYDDIEGIKKRIKSEFDAYPRKVQYKNLEQFSRKALTKDLARVLKNVSLHG